MPYQAKNCVKHGYNFFNERNEDDAFDLSHWDNDDDSILDFIPMIEDENEFKHFFDRTVCPNAYWSI